MRKLSAIQISGAALALPLLLSAPLRAEPPAAEPMEAAPMDWSQAARQDILAAYDQYLRNHPGPYDLENPGFPAQLAEARSAGLAIAETAQSELDYRRALAAFSAQLQDGHAVVYDPTNQQKSEAAWPGFVALWRDGALYARTQDSAEPLNRARITACNGEPIVQFLQDTLLTRYFRASEEGQWYVRPSQLFFARSGKLGDEPAECTFAMRGGDNVTLPLSWQSLDEEAEDFASRLIYGEKTPTALREAAPGIFWIGLQDFQPDDAGVAEFKQLYAEVAARREELKHATALVLDLRRNNGGSSVWSHDLAEILWGKSAMASRDRSSAHVDWRASPGNTPMSQRSSRNTAGSAMRMWRVTSPRLPRVWNPH
ncbi:S41 family peptidase [Altericroceibacterium endophyticum]|uniref:Uncharacterized protein n=1 Tax=Altericroceibacterium endophyticum TaxID=1808508 RepID=A0A6I4T6V8_9SPHN|nr:S41 family peptidase [Altericroceibacterium endophyticum]MXO65942.1 hypothetical protein [Altericroceibacterium endophyticum]